MSDNVLENLNIWLQGGDVGRLEILSAASGCGRVLRLALMDLGERGSDYVKSRWDEVDKLYPKPHNDKREK